MDGDEAPPPAGTTRSAGNLARAILASAHTTPSRSASAGAAKVALALTLRPGHVVLTGPEAGVAETLLAATEEQLGAMRLLRTAATDLQIDDFLAALHDASRDRRVAAVVTDADRLSVAALERLHAGLDPDALARGRVRLVLLGGPGLGRTLRDDRLRALMTRVCLELEVPSAETVQTVGRGGILGARPRLSRLFSSVGPLELAGLAMAILVGGSLWVLLAGDSDRVRPDRVAAIAPDRATDAPAVSDSIEALAEGESGPPSTGVSEALPTDEALVPGDVEAEPVDVGRTSLEAEPKLLDVEPAPLAAAPEPPAPPRAVGAPEVALPPGAGLQVGAFADPANAARLAARLRERFEGVEVTTVVRGSRTLHRVRIVGFRSEAQRRAAARTLAADGLAARRIP